MEDFDRAGLGGRVGSIRSMLAGGGVVGVRVLSLDDHRAQAEMVAAILEPVGYQVSIATSGEAVLELLASEAFDILVADVDLGTGMTGLDLADQVRERYPTVRVVLVTGWSTHIDPQDAQQRGIEGILAKPFRVADLRRLVEQVTPGYSDVPGVPGVPGEPSLP